MYVVVAATLLHIMIGSEPHAKMDGGLHILSASVRLGRTRGAHTIDRRPLHAECGSVETTYKFEVACTHQKNFQSAATTTYTFEVARTRC